MNMFQAVAVVAGSPVRENNLTISASANFRYTSNNSRIIRQVEFFNTTAIHAVQSEFSEQTFSKRRASELKMAGKIARV